MGAPGPLSLGMGLANSEDLENLALLTTRYSDHQDQAEVSVKILASGKNHQKFRLTCKKTTDPLVTEKFRIT